MTDPQQIADFIGTLIHGDEVDLLTVQLDTEFQLGFDCGFGAEACYFTGENKIVISGYEEADGDGATFDFVLAHEYGHHVATTAKCRRPSAARSTGGPSAGPASRTSARASAAAGSIPGDEGSHYFEDPGEAFAEAFAHLRFPQDSRSPGATCRR